MKRIALVLNPLLAAMLLGACSTPPKAPDSAWKIAPVQSVRHGAPGAAGHYALGRHQESRGATDDAIASYRRAIEADPTQVAAWSALGTLLARNGRLDEALTALERAVSLAPAASHAHNNLGYALLLAGRDVEAVTPLQKAVDLDMGNRRAFGNLATAYRRLGQLDEAMRAAARAGSEADAQPALALASAADPPPATLIGSDPGLAAPEGRPAPARADLATRTSVGRIRPAPMPRVATSAVRPASSLLTHVARNAPQLVKLGDNLYQLHIAPVTPATEIDQAVAIVARAVKPEPAGGLATSAARSPQPPAAGSRPEQLAGAMPAATVAHVSEGRSSRDSAATGAEASSDSPTRYEIANGHGGKGLAKRVANLVAVAGTQQPRLTNQRPFEQTVSYVEYREGFQDTAQIFASRLPFRPKLRSTPSSTIGVDVRLVLGHDLTTSAACAALGLCNGAADRRTTTLASADAPSTGQP